MARAELPPLAMGQSRYSGKTILLLSYKQGDKYHLPYTLTHLVKEEDLLKDLERGPRQVRNCPVKRQAEGTSRE